VLKILADYCLYYGAFSREKFTGIDFLNFAEFAMHSAGVCIREFASAQCVGQTQLGASFPLKGK
jgi:hypothetical protein